MKLTTQFLKVFVFLYSIVASLIKYVSIQYIEKHARAHTERESNLYSNVSMAADHLPSHHMFRQDLTLHFP